MCWDFSPFTNLSGSIQTKLLAAEEWQQAAPDSHDQATTNAGGKSSSTRLAVGLVAALI